MNTYKRWVWNFLLAFVLSVFPIFSKYKFQAQELDPLLRKPWIPEILEEEEREFNRVGSVLLSRPHFIVKKDKWNRNYKLLHDGRVEYILDEAYRRKFPSVDDTFLNFSEAETLKKKKFWIPSYHLLNGILLCFRQEQNSMHYKSLEIRSTKLQNEILQEMADKKQDLEILGDPYGCIVDDSLHLESKAFNYKLKIPKDWRMEYSNDVDEVSDIKEQYSARYQRFYLPLNVEETRTWEDEYVLSQLGLNRFRKEKIVFFIGSLFQKQPIFNKENFYKIWDWKRGLNPSTMREWNLRRSEKNPGYEMRMNWISEKEETKIIVIREYYYWKKNRGLFLSLSYPVRESESMEAIWKEIVSNLSVRSQP